MIFGMKFQIEYLGGCLSIPARAHDARVSCIAASTSGESLVLAEAHTLGSASPEGAVTRWVWDASAGRSVSSVEKSRCSSLFVQPGRYLEVVMRLSQKLRFSDARGVLKCTRRVLCAQGSASLQVYASLLSAASLAHATPSTRTALTATPPPCHRHVMDHIIEIKLQMTRPSLLKLRSQRAGSPRLGRCRRAEAAVLLSCSDAFMRRPHETPSCCLQRWLAPQARLALLPFDPRGPQRPLKWLMGRGRD